MSGPLDISLKDELLFIKSLLIPAFNPKNKLDTPAKRDEWLANRAEQKKWDPEVAAELIERYGTVNSLEEAKAERTKVEGLLEKAEENERKHGKKSIIRSHSLFFTLLSFPVYCYLVFHMLLNLCCFHLLFSSGVVSVGGGLGASTGNIDRLGQLCVPIIMLNFLSVRSCTIRSERFSFQRDHHQQQAPSQLPIHCV
jgi:hypothetical protein